MKEYLVKKRALYDGYQKLYKFPNGYGASVVNHSGSYGLELAVIKWDDDDWDLCYSTPITDNVLGYLTEELLEEILKSIRELEVQEDD